MVETKPILIAGAGLASLLLAHSLQLSRIPYILFERDSSFVFRAQGYRLRLSNEGLDAIESVLDKETWAVFWEKCGKTGGSGFVTYDAVSGEVIDKNLVAETLTSRGGEIVGISRGDMRRVFATGCEDHIEWGKHVTGYELTDNGVRAVFADGSKSVEGSLLVGGEGVNSRVAQQVSGGRIKVYDTGARGIHGQAPTVAFRALGEGVFRILDNSPEHGGVSLMTNVRRNDMENPSVEFGWTLGGKPNVIQVPGNDFTLVGKQAADLAKSLTAHWHPRFRPLFTEMNAAESAFWKITCSSPSGIPEWPNEPRVTLIGDAVHAMTPAGGIGANTAVRDSALLGRLLREAGGYKPGVTAAYEKEMRVYGSQAVHHSYSTATGVMGIHIDEKSTPTIWESSGKK